MNIKSIKKIVVVGVGFMGGSLALALKKRFPKVSVWGYARSKKSYNKLKKLRILDKVNADLKKCVENADIIVLALPVNSTIEYFKRIAPFLKRGAIVFDLGSSKSNIESQACRYLPKNISFVGCHPLCGSEKSGAEFACSKLYDGAFCLITSSPKGKAVGVVKKLWEKIGSKVVFINANSHDKMLSFVSHLPHLISFSFTQSVPEKYIKFSAASFKDLTRIAVSPASVWTDIFLSNKKNIKKDLNSFIKTLRKFDKLLDKGSKNEIINFIKKINCKASHLS